MVLSHPSIVEGTRRSNGAAMGSSGGDQSSTQRMMKEKTLRDITDKLEAKSVNMKTTRSGLKSMSGVVFREVGPATKWTSHVVKPNDKVNGHVDLNADKLRAGHLPSRPPDPTRALSINMTSEVAPGQMPDGSRAQSQEAADGEHYDLSDATEMKGVQMEIGAAGPTSTTVRFDDGCG